MKNTLRFLTLCATIISTEMTAQVVINEIMQSNIDCITDDLNEFPDSWVELYNAGTERANLGTYSINISDDAAKAWKLPETPLEPGDYAIVYCDKVGKGMHTNFRLESGKGAEVYLYNKEVIADCISGLKKQPAPNIAYGRETDNASKWGYMATATPGSANCGRTCKDILGDPIFSTKGKAMNKCRIINLAMTMPKGTPEGAEIRYTTDGSEPTASSTLYSSTITFNSNKTIRAKIFCDGYLSPRSVTQSYIFHEREVTLPVVSIVTDETYMYDDKFGIYVDGTYAEEAKNYTFGWRRPINIEYFDGQESESVINQLGEARVAGAASREFTIKSLAVYANKRFGEKRLKYEFFHDQRPGVTDYKSILLRNAGNDFNYLYMRDAIIQRSMAQYADLDWQAWQPAIVYINGIYLGILNIRERSNEDNIYTNYDGLEDIDMIENWWDTKTGDSKNFIAFREFYNEHNHTLDEYRKWMDIEEYINLMLMNIFYNNRDFPGNNFVMWRPRTEDGVWRFVAKDTDFGLGLYDVKPDYKTIDWINNHEYDPTTAWANEYDHTRLFRRLMDIDDFRQMFVDRAAIYMGDFLNLTRVSEIWDAMYQMIKTEYPYHRKGINPWWPNYNDEMTNARTFLRERPAHVYNNLAEYYNLGTPTKLTVNTSVENAEAMETSINGIKLTRGVFDGKYFRGMHVSIRCPQAKGWNIETKTKNGTASRQAEGPEYEFDMPECASIAINAIVDGKAIDTIETEDMTVRNSAEGITLDGVVKGTPIEIYDLRGMAIYKGLSSGDATTIPTPTGQIYILKVGDKTIKTQH